MKQTKKSAHKNTLSPACVWSIISLFQALYPFVGALSLPHVLHIHRERKGERYFSLFVCVFQFLWLLLYIHCSIISRRPVTIRPTIVPRTTLQVWSIWVFTMSVYICLAVSSVCVYVCVCACVRVYLANRPCQSSVDYGNTNRSSMQFIIHYGWSSLINTGITQCLSTFVVCL